MISMEMINKRIYIGGGYHLYKRKGERYFERRYDWQNECYPFAWQETRLDLIKATEWQYAKKVRPLTEENMSPGMYLDEGEIRLWKRAKDDLY